MPQDSWDIYVNCNGRNVLVYGLRKLNKHDEELLYNLLHFVVGPENKQKYKRQLNTLVKKLLKDEYPDVY